MAVLPNSISRMYSCGHVFTAQSFLKFLVVINSATHSGEDFFVSLTNFLSLRCQFGALEKLAFQACLLLIHPEAL